MFRRLMEHLVAAGNPLAAMQAEAVRLQDSHGGWSKQFFEQLTHREVQQAVADPCLAQAEALFRKIRQEGRGLIPPGAMAVTTFQLALLLHRQGRLAEARDLYEEVVRICRLHPECTDTQCWALGHALFRLAEMIIYEDRARAEELFAESRQLAYQRGDQEAIDVNSRATRWFGLMGQPADRSGAEPAEGMQLLASARRDVWKQIGTAQNARQPQGLLINSIAKQVLVVLIGIGAGFAVGIYLRSKWLGGLAGLYVLSVANWLALPLSGRRRVAYLTLLAKAIFLSVVVTALVRYFLGSDWLAAAVGFIVMLEMFRRSLRRLPPEDKDA